MGWFGLLLVMTLMGCRDRVSTSRQSPTNLADSGIPVAPADTTWQDPAAHRAGFVSSGGVRIQYLDFGGKGEPLVLLTGLGSSAHIFDDFAPRFTDRFRVVAITRRGHAQSDHPPSGYALDQLVDDLKAVLDTLGLDRVTLEADFRLNTTSSDVTDAILKDVTQSPAWKPNFRAIRAPTLVLYTLATLERRRPCVASLADKERVHRAEAYLRDVFRPHQLAAVERLKRELPHAQVVELKGHHFLFVSNEDEVVKVMREFVKRTPH
jgi:hypothetical protein